MNDYYGILTIENKNIFKIMSYSDFIKNEIIQKTNVQYLMGHMLINTEKKFKFEKTEYDKIICILDYDIIDKNNIDFIKIKKNDIGTFKIKNANNIYSTLQKNDTYDLNNGGISATKFKEIMFKENYELKINNINVNVENYDTLSKHFDMPFNYAFKCDVHMSPGKAYHASHKNPRTCVIIDKYDNVIFIVIEGRGGNNYQGVTLDELANICELLDAKYALNLDGGGTSCMIVYDSNNNNTYSKCSLGIDEFKNYIQIKFN
jgi:hypothetical protein